MVVSSAVVSSVPLSSVVVSSVAVPGAGVSASASVVAVAVADGGAVSLPEQAAASSAVAANPASRVRMRMFTAPR